MKLKMKDWFLEYDGVQISIYYATIKFISILELFNYKIICYQNCIISFGFLQHIMFLDTDIVKYILIIFL